MVQGKKRVQHIPKEWVEEVRRRVKAGREFQDAVREVLAANAQLLVLERKKLKEKMNRSTPRHLLHFVTRRLRLRQYLKDPGDGRQQPQIPAQALLWALLIGKFSGSPVFMRSRRWCDPRHDARSPSRLRSVTIPWAISPSGLIPSNAASPALAHPRRQTQQGL